MLNGKPMKAPTRDQEVTLLIDADYWTYMMSALTEHKTVQPDKSTTPVEKADGSLVHVEPVEHLHYLIYHAISELKDRFRTDKCLIHLTGDGNFREEIAVTKPYKGNRHNVKPYYYKEARRYLLEDCDAILIEGQEADDEVAILQYACMQGGQPSVIVSPDKDLKNMFGYRYNPRTKELSYNLPHDSAYHFYCQMIIGDSVDNIPGCNRKGKKFVTDVLDTIPKVDDPADIRQVQEFIARVRYEVESVYASRGHDDDYYLEQGILLHMRRRPDEMWTPEYDWLRGHVDLRPVFMVETDDD